MAAINGSPVFEPTHPGVFLKTYILPLYGLTVTAAAEELDVDRITLSRLVNKKSAMSPEMAVRLEQWLYGKGYDGKTVRAEVWLSLQARHDVWAVQEVRRPNIAADARHLPRDVADLLLTLVA